jgi:hypothetical protein
MHYSFIPCVLHAVHISFDRSYPAECKIWSSWLCSPIEPLIMSSPLGPDILLSTLFSNALFLRLSLIPETEFHTHTKLYCSFVYFMLYVLDVRREDKVLNWVPVRIVRIYSALRVIQVLICYGQKIYALTKWKQALIGLIPPHFVG